MTANNKRLFFGLEINAPWPKKFPTGRILQESDRHLTLAFLGNIDYSILLNHLSHIPSLPLTVGLSGYFTESLFLPKNHPNVVAWGLKFLDDDTTLKKYQKDLSTWLKNIEFKSHEYSEWLYHVTLSRKPFLENEWLKAFSPLPFYFSNLHLYESLGQSTYKPIHTWELLNPIEKLSENSFLIRGENETQITNHIETALAFFSADYQTLLNSHSEGILKKDNYFETKLFIDA